MDTLRVHGIFYKPKNLVKKRERGKKNESKHEKICRAHDCCRNHGNVLPDAGICC